MRPAKILTNLDAPSASDSKKFSSPLSLLSLVALKIYFETTKIFTQKLAQFVQRLQPDDVIIAAFYVVLPLTKKFNSRTHQVLYSDHQRRGCSKMSAAKISQLVFLSKSGGFPTHCRSCNGLSMVWTMR
jgi:hypothetical protein